VSEALVTTVPLTRWQGDRGTYHLVTITGEAAEAIVGHALMHRLEYGSSRGFGSVKVMARIGDTAWKTSVFPQNKSTEWVLLISKKVMHEEQLAHGDAVQVELELL
jgi:hypothetical protein